MEEGLALGKDVGSADGLVVGIDGRKRARSNCSSSGNTQTRLVSITTLMIRCLFLREALPHG